MQKVQLAIVKYADNLWDSFRIALGKIWAYIKALIIGGIVMIIGMVAGGYIIFNLEKIILAYIGGIVASGINRMIGTSYRPIPTTSPCPGCGGGGGGTPPSPPPGPAGALPPPSPPPGPIGALPPPKDS